ncbi:MAG: hypothetical protein KA369_23700 [Spirochaetes bacterium]|nr:hypothetical protein [Spirochaetota bacterium]
MKHKMYSVLGIVLVFLMVLALDACKKKPSKIQFSNMKNYDYCNSYSYVEACNAVLKENKSYTDYFTRCKNRITTKPCLIMGTRFEKPIGSSTVKMQLIDSIRGSVIFSKDYDTMPDMTTLQIVYNLTAKGKYKINFIVKDEIIAQGSIEYK